MVLQGRVFKESVWALMVLMKELHWFMVANPLSTQSAPAGASHP